MATYPVLTSRQWQEIHTVLVGLAENPNHLSNQDCTYSEALKAEITAIVTELESIFLKGLKTELEGPNSDLTLLIKETITDVKKVINSANASDSARVSASKFLFDLIQRDVEIRERLANIEKVVKLEALIKQFFSEQKDPDVADDFLRRLEAIQ